MASSEARKNDKKTGKPATAEEIYSGFQILRNEQRSLANKLTEFSQDINEHTLVIQTLEKVDPDRKCFRMLGGILVERTVKDVLPALKENLELMGQLVEKLTQKLEEKGAEINEYKEKFNIRIGNQTQETAKEEEAAAPSESRGNVLVS